MWNKTIDKLIEKCNGRFRWLKNRGEDRWLAQAVGVTSTTEDGRTVRSKDIIAKGKSAIEAMENLIDKLDL